MNQDDSMRQFLSEGSDQSGDANKAGFPEIAGYELQESIGEGGMGVVYLANQLKPIKRSVAIKVIKPGMDSKQVIARFSAERQALGMMDHPNIARVLDAGATTDGRPYFAMELVSGAPITAFCDEHRYTIAQRLSLFIEVCQAVQHAHQKGVIHRDIKPSNVLVSFSDGQPSVKVIDFGLVKALEPDLNQRRVGANRVSTGRGNGALYESGASRTGVVQRRHAQRHLFIGSAAL